MVFSRQAGCKDPFTQACARKIWLECAQHEITLVVSHTPAEALGDSVEALSHWNLAQVYGDRVDKWVQDKSVTMFVRQWMNVSTSKQP